MNDAAITELRAILAATVDVFAMLVEAILEAQRCGRRNIWLFSTADGVEYGFNRESFGSVEPFSVIRV